MKAALLVKVLVPNAVILALIWEVLQDQAGRLAYFRSLGFAPTTTYYPFFYITSAVDGSIRIQGLLTLDWFQVLAVVLVVLDVVFALGYFRSKNRETPVPPPGAA